MASIGLDKLYIAKYNYDGTNDAVSYSDGMRWKQAMKMDVSSGSSDPNKLWGDDGVVEIDRSTGEGSITLGVGHMPFDVYALMFNKEVTEVTVTGETGDKGKLLSDGGDEDAPYLGLGVVVTQQVDNKKQYMAAILKKVQFDWPDDAYVTTEESVEWQTPSLSGTVMRADDSKHAMREYAIFGKKSTAEKYIKQVLNIVDANALEA